LGAGISDCGIDDHLVRIIDGELAGQRIEEERNSEAALARATAVALKATS